MAEKDYAIVCDETSDLPLSFLERAGVVPLRLDDARDAAGALGRVYRDLAGRGFPQVISIHSAALFSPVVDGARSAAEACADVCDVLVVDSGSASAATGMLVDRAARYRHLGVPAPEAAGLIGRAAASLRMRVTGERGLYLLARGELTQLARGNDPAALTGRLARAVATVAGNEGPLVHALAEAGDVRSLRALERALEEEGVGSSCLGTVRATPLSREVVGAGAVAAAIAPHAAYWR